MKHIRNIAVIGLSTLAVLAAQVAPVAAGWGRPRPVDFPGLAGITTGHALPPIGVRLGTTLAKSTNGRR